MSRDYSMEERARRAVQEFEEVAEEMAAYQDEHSEVLNVFLRMAEEYNTCLAEAQQSVRGALQADTRAKQLVLGPIGIKRSTSVVWDGDILADRVSGELTDLFLTPFHGYKVDGKELARLIRVGEVSAELIADAKEEKDTLRAMPGSPKPIVVAVHRRDREQA